MPAPVRSVLAVLAGLATLFVLILVAEFIGHLLDPIPPGLDPTRPEDLPKIAAAMPTRAFISVLVGWAIGAFGGGWVAARLARRAPLGHAGVVGGLGLLAAIANLAMIPSPLWMWVGGIAVFPVGSALGGRVAARPAGGVVPEPAGELGGS